MKIPRINRLSTQILLILIGISYFTFFSNLEITPFLKGYVAIIPIQILVLLYFVYNHVKQQ